MKIIIDLDAPDQIPLRAWLIILRKARIDHEMARDHNATLAAKRLGVSRYTVYRALDFR